MMEKYDIIIQAGQSNAEGFGIGTVKEVYLPSSDILYLSAKKKVKTVDNVVQIEYSNKPFDISVAEERTDKGELVGDFSLTFANDYLKTGLLENNRKVLIIRAAVGGTGFTHGHWMQNGPQYEKMLEMIDYALQLSSQSRIVAFLWHQGEHDANCRMNPILYRHHLEQLIISVRHRYSSFVIPFLAGDFVPEWRDKNAQKTFPILKELRKVCNDDDRSCFVESDGLLSNSQKNGGNDELHFCRESLYDLGHRYFTAFKRLNNL